MSKMVASQSSHAMRVFESTLPNLMAFQGLVRTLPLANRGDAIDALLLWALHDGHCCNALLGIHQNSAAANCHIVWQEVKRDVACRWELHSSTQIPDQE